RSLNDLSPKFREIFSDKYAPTLKPTKAALIGLGSMWFILFSPKIIMELMNINSVFPPLSGPLTWLSDTLFLIVATIIVGITIYLAIRTFRYFRYMEQSTSEIQSENVDV